MRTVRKVCSPCIPPNGKRKHTKHTKKTFLFGAAALAFRAGLVQCSPVLLEPIGKLCVFVPDSLMGDVIGDLNKRRGKIMGMDQDPKRHGWSIVEAEVPEAEMSDYVHVLRAISQGRANFTFYFERYAEVPGAVAEKIIAERQKELQG